MSWKAIKRYLSFVGIESLNPRSCFKDALSQGLIDDESVWLNMMEQRNLNSHIYDENEIKDIIDVVDSYRSAFKKLKNNLKARLKAE